MFPLLSFVCPFHMVCCVKRLGTRKSSGVNARGIPPAHIPIGCVKGEGIPPPQPQVLYQGGITHCYRFCTGLVPQDRMRGYPFPLPPDCTRNLTPSPRPELDQGFNQGLNQGVHLVNRQTPVKTLPPVSF